jgi:hypothetical protein
MGSLGGLVTETHLGGISQLKIKNILITKFKLYPEYGLQRIPGYAQCVHS